MFESKLLHEIYSQTMEDGVWRRKHIRAVKELFGEPDIVGVIRGSRLRWGHILRKTRRI